MTAPSVQDALAYLGFDESGWGEADVQSAYLAEKAAQSAVCVVPADNETWPSDLSEALCRRVAANLAVRRLPLGVDSSISEFGAIALRVGGGDREVERLEAPYRVIPVA